MNLGQGIASRLWIYAAALPGLWLVVPEHVAPDVHLPPAP